MIIRERYIREIRKFYDSDLIKIITGIRRCGKSVILEQIKNEIEKNSNNIIYLNFEDKYMTQEIRNAIDLIEYVKNNRKDSQVYLFLDEIQELEDWQDACKTLRLHNASIFITGSNSKLLSGEFTKELSGRYVSFRIRPFVYTEMKEYAKQLGKNVDIMDYIVWGGFPGRLEQMDKKAELRYLQDLNDTIVLNDLIKRYNIRKVDLFTSLVNYVLKSNSRIFSAKSIHTYIKQQHLTCSINTIIKYLDYLQEAYIIDEIKMYSTKVKRELSFYRKIYNGDVSFNSIRTHGNGYDLTHNFENVVYNELLYKGYDLMVYNDFGREIDFVAEKNNKKYYIQVAYSVAEEKARQRELSAFSHIDGIDKKILITNDNIDFSTSNVEHYNFERFLESQYD